MLPSTTTMPFLLEPQTYNLSFRLIYKNMLQHSVPVPNCSQAKSKVTITVTIPQQAETTQGLEERFIAISRNLTTRNCFHCSWGFQQRPIWGKWRVASVTAPEVITFWTMFTLCWHIPGTYNVRLCSRFEIQDSRKSAAFLQAGTQTSTCLKVNVTIQVGPIRRYLTKGFFCDRLGFFEHVSDNIWVNGAMIFFLTFSSDSLLYGPHLLLYPFCICWIDKF